MRRQLPPLRSVEYFEAVAEHESIVSAAEHLGVTKGAVSQQIRLLEEYLGSELFDRSGRRILLNDAGQRYYSAVESSLSTLERATKFISKQKQRTTFHLTVLPAFASMWLVQRLLDFQGKFPSIDIEISADAAMTNFTRSGTHLGIRYSKGNTTGLVATNLCTDNLSPVCSPEYLKEMKLQHPTDLERCRLLHDTYWNEDWQNWCTGTNTLLPNRQEGQYFTHYSVAIEAAKSGAGIAMGHELLVKEQVNQGNLVQPFDISVPACEPYVLVYPKRHNNVGFVKGFEIWVKSQL